MDFTLPPRVEQTRLAVRGFVAEHLLPLEADRANYDAHENIREDLLETLRAKARDRGLWCLQMPKERGGQGLDPVGMAACYEEMNRSIFGPVVFNAAAPDDGNMFVLNRVAREDQKDRWLQPIVDGAVRSSFALTEPAPGGGSDPSMIRTTATRRGSDWVIEGRKWYITGAGVARHFILIAKTGDDPRRGLTAFLFHADQPGWRIVRRIPIMGPEEHGGHCELEFDGLTIPDENRLMDVGDGLKLTQIRLEIAAAYVADRESFGAKLIDHEGVQWMLGEAAMAVSVGRQLTMHAAWKLEQGDKARTEVSMAKIQVSETLHRAVDTAIQLCGAKGYSKDTVLEWIYRYARQARLVDGASEVHKMVLARNYARAGADFWSWG